MNKASLEKQFFDAFGIESKSIFKGCTLGAKYYSEICKEETCKGCDCEIRETEYPQITDRILLELICIISNYCQTKFQCDYQLYSVNIDKLRQEVLRDCMEYCCEPIDIECIKNQVRKLFEEG